MRLFGEYGANTATMPDETPSKHPTMIGKRATNTRQNSQIKKGRRSAPLWLAAETPQRLENWNERRALARPYFLRSTTHEPLVRNPPRFNTPRRSGSEAGR